MLSIDNPESGESFCLGHANIGRYSGCQWAWLVVHPGEDRCLSWRDTVTYAHEDNGRRGGGCDVGYRARAEQRSMTLHACRSIPYNPNRHKRKLSEDSVLRWRG